MRYIFGLRCRILASDLIQRHCTCISQISFAVSWLGARMTSERDIVSTVLLLRTSTRVLASVSTDLKR